MVREKEEKEVDVVIVWSTRMWVDRDKTERQVGSYKQVYSFCIILFKFLEH